MSTTIASKNNSVAMLPANKRNPRALAANITKPTAYITAAGTHDGKLAKCDGHRAREPIIWEGGVTNNGDTKNGKVKKVY